MRKSKHLKKQVIELMDAYGLEFNKWVPDIRNKFFRDLFIIINRYTDDKFQI